MSSDEKFDIVWKYALRLSRRHNLKRFSKGKAQARRAFVKAIDSDVYPGDRELCVSMMHYARKKAAIKKGVETYDMMLSTWLNSSCWMDA